MRRTLVIGAVLAAALAAVPAMHAATFTVTTTNDTGAGSLRQAILDSNGTIGIPDTIDFDIAGAGPHVIQPATALPQVTDAVTIDGSAELSPGGFPLVTVDGGAGTAPSLYGLDVAPTNAAGTTIRALAFTRWDTGNGAGLRLAGAGVQGVFGSLFGLDSTGTALGNYGGIAVLGGSGQQIGGVTASDRNVVSGNVTGIALNATQANVVGNWIGVGLDGTTAMANSIQGILVATTNNTIGSRSAGAGNRIRGNGAGVRVVSGTLNTIAGNSIDQNSGLGIDLGFDNVTANDSGDGDSGPNTLQNFPVLTSAVKSGSTLDVSGTIDTVTVQEVTIDYYASAACDGSGNGEGDRFVASVLVNADTPNKAFENGVDGSVVNVGDVLTATTTDSNGNTSEFSACVTVTGAGEIVVNSAADPGDGTCDAAECTLREAIAASNATPITPETITFAIGTGAQVILPSTPLPDISAPVTIDGTTQPGFGSSPLIQVDGVNIAVGDTTPGLRLAEGADGSVVKALSITQFEGTGVEIDTDDVGLSGNWIGIQPDGSAGGSNGTGVRLTINADGADIGGASADRNVITDWGASNIHVAGAATTTIASNIIGLLPDGTTGTGTSSSIGVLVDTDATSTLIGGAPTGGNVIADATNTVDLQGSSGTTVLGNLIGVEADGVTPVAIDIGVNVQGSDNNTIGSTAAGGANTIVAGDDAGVLLINGSNNNTVAGNFIGTNAAGSPGLGNGSGVRELNGSGNNTIGPGNEIANNNFQGIQLLDTGIRITANSIHDNLASPGQGFGLGIDLGQDGVTPNDGEDGDTGPNNLQNFPVLTSATAIAGDLDVAGTIRTVGNVRVEVFASPTCDPSGNGEGETFLGFTDVPVDQPEESFTLTGLDATGLSDGDAITATATDAAGNTSEFSACIFVDGVGQTFVVNSNADPGDGTCDATCTLRDAVLNANASPTDDRIEFAIGSGAATILLASKLSVNDTVVIDGTTQPGFAGNPLIELDGTNVVADATPGDDGGVEIGAGASGSEVRGLVVNDFPTNGIGVYGGGITIAGNWIGLDVDGSSPRSNDFAGVYLQEATGTMVGGTTPEDKNVIADNDGDGVRIVGFDGFDNTVRGNWIGVAADGVTELGNLGAGVFVDSARNQIGPDNLIVANGSSATGVAIDSGTRNRITRNGIHDNLGLGIDLEDDGPTPNDGGDIDSGPNDLQNFPDVTAVTVGATDTMVSGTLASTGNQTYDIEVFSSPTCDASTFGEGETYLGTTQTTTDDGGSGAWTLNVPSVLTAGHVVTATATDPLGNTSEFSACATVGAGGTVSTLLFIQPGSSSVTAPARVELADVPAATFIDATSQVNASPIGAIPIGAIPIGAIPIGAIPIGAIGFTDPAIRPLLSGITLSTVPLTPPRSWEALLANIPSLAGLPLQSITLQQALDALAAQPTGAIQSVPIGAIGLSNNVLGTLTPEALGLGTASLSAIDVGDEGTDEPGDTNLEDWCEWLSGPPINCTTSSQLTDESVLSTALRGAPIGAIPIGAIPIGAIPIGAIPIGAIPIGAIDLNFSPIGAIPIGAIPIGAIPIGAIPIGAIPIGAINLQASPIGAIPIGAIPIGAISTLFDCSGASCPTNGTIRDHAGQLRSGLTLEQFIRAVGPAALGDIGFADVLEFVSDAGLGNLTVEDLVDTLNLIPNNGLTLADLLAAFLAEGSLGWEGLNLEAAKVNELASESGKAGYRVGIELTPDGPGGGGAVHSTSIAVTLPEGFSYVPGTSTLDQAATPEVQAPDPTVAGRVLTWTLPLAAGPGYLLDFETVPGLTLGPTEATVEATPAGSPTATGPDPAGVTVVDTFEPNDNPAGALTALSTSAFYLSYITGADDVDNFTYPVPPVPGTRVTFRLSHLPADYDIVVYGPNGQVLRPLQPGTELLDGAPLDDDGPTLTSRQEALPEQTLNDVVLADLPVLGYSTLRGDDDDAVTVVSDGVAGNYTIQVTGFNGASSLEPYMLRAEQRAPINVPACQPRSFPSTGTNATSLTRGTVPANVNTVFVVNKAQWERIHTAGIVGPALTSLDNQMADLAADGFPSAILQVDADAGVQAAVASWNACPTELTRANTVVREVSRVVDQFRAAHLDAGGNSTVRNIVLLGDDDAVPAARLEDRTTVANEEGYAETFGNATDLGTALRLSYFLSDDPYGDVDPIPFFDRQLHIPDVPVGRLATQPGDVVRAVSRFTFFNGQLAPATAVTSGYDFLADGAQQVDNALRSIGGVTGQNPAGLIGNSWNKSALLSGLLPGGVPRDLTSVNGHADHRAIQPATGSDLFGPGDLPPLAAGPTANQAYDRKVVFSMGCHAGLSVADTFVTAPSLGATDWPEAYSRRGATYAGNTGYGYGDGALVAYSEDLQRRFAEHLGGFATQGDLTVGEAMVLAKQDYFGELGLVGVYDEKASSELTLYGLPMWRVGPATQPLTTGAGTAAAKTAASSDAVGGPIASLSAPDDRQLVTEPGTGLPAEQLTTNWTPPAPTPAPGGFYVNGKDGVQVTHFRPVEPKTVLPVTVARAHGALITELSSESDTPFDPYFARPIVDASAKEPLLDWDRLVHPAKLQTVTTSKLGTTKLHRLVLATGQFTGAEGGGETGTQRLFTHMQALVMSSPSNDYAQPILGRISATVVGSTVAFSVDTRDRAPNGANDVVRVLVGYLDQPDGSATRAWRFVDLAHAGATTHWSGAGPLASPTAPFLFFVQAVDRAGNVAVSTNKGVYYEESTQPPPAANGLEIQAPSPPASGWFGGNVAVTLLLDGQPAAEDDDLLVDVDGNGFDPYTGTVTVSGDGPHTVTGRAPDGREVARTVLIDTAGPQALIGTPADGSQLVQGQVARADYTCLDAGAGVDSTACVGTVPDGAQVNTATLGTKTFTVNATDRLGKTGSKTVSYTVVGPPVASITSTPPPITSQTSASFTFTATPGDATFECKLDSGAFVACTSPQSYTGLSATGHTFSVRALKGGVAGPTASFSWTITTSLTGKIVFVRGTATNHDLWLLDPSGASAPIQLTRDASDDIQPALSPSGTTVLFARRTTAGGPYHLYRLDLSGLTTTAVAMVGTNSSPAWSRDGTKVAWDSTRTGSKGVDVFSAPWVAATGTLGAATNLTNINGNDVTPSWSANGAQLAFASDRNKNQFEIFTMNANGSSQTRITNDPKTDVEPSWSPDGTKIAFSSDRAGGTGGFELFVMGAPNGSAQTRLTNSAGADGQPTWLSATRIVFASARTPAGGLLSIAPTGGAATTFPGTAVGDSQPG